MQGSRATSVSLWQIVAIAVFFSVVAWLVSNSVLAAALTFVFVAGGRLGQAYWRAVSKVER